MLDRTGRAQKFELLKSESVPLTRELAEQFRTMKCPPTERPMDLRRIKFLQERASAGLLVSFSWATADLNGEVLRVNGQHSSNMLCSLNGLFPENLMCHIDRYKVENKDGLSLLSRQFDGRSSSRSSLDISGYYQKAQDDLMALDIRDAQLGAKAIQWWRQKVEIVVTSSGDDIYEVFQEPEEHPFLIFLNELLTPAMRQMRRPPIVAAVYETFKANEDEAKIFWFAVTRNTDDPEGETKSPISLLDIWLRRLVIDHDEVKAKHFWQGCIFAWNAHRQGKEIREIKSDFNKGLLRAMA